MSGPTWNDGQLTEDDVIESADGTGYTSPSDFISGDDGYEQDDHSDDGSDDHDTDHDL